MTCPIRQVELRLVPGAYEKKLTIPTFRFARASEDYGRNRDTDPVSVSSDRVS